MKSRKFFAIGTIGFCWILLIDIALLVAAIFVMPFSIYRHNFILDFIADIVLSILIWLAWIAWKFIIVRCTRMVIIDEQGIHTTYLKKTRQTIFWDNIKTVRQGSVFFFMRFIYLSEEDIAEGITIEIYSEKTIFIWFLLYGGAKKAIKQFYPNDIVKEKDILFQIFKGKNKINETGNLTDHGDNSNDSE